VGQRLAVCDSSKVENQAAIDGVDRVIHAMSPRERQDAIIALFRDANDDRIRELMRHPDTGIALTAAWERVLHPLPEETQENFTPLPDTELHWFLGFVEGRLRTDLPAWWKACLLQSRAQSRSLVTVFFTSAKGRGNTRTLSEYFPYSRTEANVVLPGTIGGLAVPFFAARGMSVTTQGRFLRMSIRGASYDIPSETIESSKGNGGYLAAATGREVLYVAPHSSRVQPFTLMCFDQGSDKARWTADVWTNERHFPHGTTGTREHWVTLDTSGDAVTVIGMADLGGPYLESFSKEDGKNIFRFDSPYFIPAANAAKGKSKE
jgi:hypothetical protein